MTTEMNLDALSEPVRCAVLTERLPKELRKRGVEIRGTYIDKTRMPNRRGAMFANNHGLLFTQWGKTLFDAVEIGVSNFHTYTGAAQ